MSVLRRKRARPQPDVEHHIRDELAAILPILRIDQCAIELMKFDSATGTAVLFIKGGCAECDCSPATFMQGIETQLKLRVSELKAVLITEEAER
ncbi:MAG TPA: NifU family protein [Gemmatimonadaceae bacterium]|jgi:Fe-S cluster biogenesis protein NfuA|nr:NifU family protein [Gemmatimonadaceae bacterium]